MDFSIDPDADEPGPASRLKYLFMLPLFAANLGGQQRNAAAFRQVEDRVNDLLNGLTLDRLLALRAMGYSYPSKKQPEIVINFGYGSHGGPGIVRNTLLVDGNGGGQTLDVIHVRLIHAPQELAGVGGEGFHVAPLAFGIDRVEGQGTLAGAGNAGDYHQFFPRNGNFYVLEIVLPGTFDMDVLLGHFTAPWPIEVASILTFSGWGCRYKISEEEGSNG